MAKMRKSVEEKIDDLATVTATGFEETHKEIAGLREEMKDGFNRIENILLRNHDNRLDRLKDFMRETKTLLKIK